MIVAHVRVDLVTNEVVGVGVHSFIPCSQNGIGQWRRGLAMMTPISTLNLKLSGDLHCLLRPRGDGA